MVGLRCMLSAVHSIHVSNTGAENDFNRVALLNRVALAIPKTGFKERRRPSSAAEIAAVSARDNLFWVRPPSRQVRAQLIARCIHRLMLPQLPPPEALHLNAPRKQDEPTSAASGGQGPERRRSNSAIGMCVAAAAADFLGCLTRFSWFRRAGVTCLMR